MHTGKAPTTVGDETLGEDDPLLAQLLAAATAGLPPAGPAQRRAPLRMALSANDKPIAKRRLCAQQWGFNLHAATRVHGDDKQGREHLCRYILRPPLANDRLHILPGIKVQLDFKRPWSDGTSSIVLDAQALIARLAAIVPPPRRPPRFPLHFLGVTRGTAVKDIPWRRLSSLPPFCPGTRPRRWLVSRSTLG